MPLYRLAESEKLVPFEAAPFPGLEKKLEDWIEHNPHILLEGETVDCRCQVGLRRSW